MVRFAALNTPYGIYSFDVGCNEYRELHRPARGSRRWSFQEALMVRFAALNTPYGIHSLSVGCNERQRIAPPRPWVKEMEFPGGPDGAFHCAQHTLRHTFIERRVQ